MNVNINSKKIGQVINGDSLIINNGNIEQKNNVIAEQNVMGDIIVSVKSLIGNNEVENALNMLINHCSVANYAKVNDFVLLKQKYVLISDRNLRGLISLQDYSSEMSNIVNAILTLTDKIET